MQFKILSIYSLVVALVLSSCSGKKEEEKTVYENTTFRKNTENTVHLTEKQMQSVGVTTITIQDRNMEKLVRLNGKAEIAPSHISSVSSIMGGHIKSINVINGSHFRKGQVLAVVEDPQFIQLQQDYLVTKAQLEAARLNFNRQKDLNTSKASSDKTMQTAQADYSTLSATLKGLEEKLRIIGINTKGLSTGNIRSKINIYAPFTGFVSKILVNNGQYINPADTLFELIDPSGLLLELKVFENDMNDVKAGQEIIVYNNQNPDVKSNAKIVSVVPSIETGGSATAIAKLSSINSQFVKGMYINAEVNISSRFTQGLPNEAVVSFENKTYVFEDLGKSNYKMVPVITGISDDQFTEIIKADFLKNKKIVQKGAYSLLMMLKNKAE
ncbi:efflux RND transporter periplasmic adaptor subunit [Chryseobacterium indologenes]|uniref:efflux RND transporter periplasmic adaptor subunit n=1 Tax=Chryseobacterium indologenes TaxID=253 RepID=UPI000B51E1B8|nr:efflux RND transporter periplasmic adaptor subunit [Chryseobacterium indologenes]ASE61190.1 efflux RND transporter periplasmic adaptor subunit [Chryseobacterium indologenes]MBF6644508.1 efflux RND transporter periplasmic adaptor subunit [Chryseobacterium indologenes]MBU3048918.1 efflux RND transporter periplasmic adaptor subunit [Chryseobacterium indologenes]QQQ71791.1 efflux RND transporter periplasmic adaptor subunit [Chryseobacterium indologenes]VFA40666.1 Cation efflux system protein Cz